MGHDARAFEVPDHDDPRRKLPGAYWFAYFNAEGFTEEPVGIIHACPCGCGVPTLLFFRGKSKGMGDEWDVSGQWPNVTLKPSIGVNKALKNPNGSYHWHGYLENGVFVER